jgi:Uup-like ABC transporter family protein
MRTRRAQAQTAATAQAAREATASSRMARRSGDSPVAKSQGPTVDQVELEIGKQEATLAQVEQALAEASSAADVARINELATLYEAARERLDQLYQQWQEMAS